MVQSRVGFFRGSSSTSGTDLNSTEAALEYSSGDYDDSVYSWSSGTNPERITVDEAGDYLVLVTVPVTGSVLRANQIIRPAVNGTTQTNRSQGSSAYIRNADGHIQSSLHLYTYLEGLSINDYITITIQQEAGAGTITADSNFQVYVEQITDNTVFSATGDSHSSGTTDFANTTGEVTLDWETEIKKDTGYTHSANSGTVTIDDAGHYIVFLNVPFVGDEADNHRENFIGRVKLDGVEVNGGRTATDILREAGSHNNTSLHWAGHIETTTSNEDLTITIEEETTATTNTVTIPTQLAILTVVKVDSARVFYKGRGNTLEGTVTDWNNVATPLSVEFTTDDIIDTSEITHSTGTNPHLVTLDTGGDYLGLFQVTLTGTDNRTAPFADLLDDGTEISASKSQCSYSRNGNGDQTSALTYAGPISDIAASSDIEWEISRGSTATGTVNDDSDATFVILDQLSTDSGPPPPSDEVDPDFVVHKLQDEIDASFANFARVATLTRPFTELVNIFDEVNAAQISQFFSQTAEEVSVIHDNITLGTAKQLAEVIATFDLVDFGVTKPISEVVDVFDERSLLTTKPVSEVVDIFDARASGASTPRTEVVDVIETRSNAPVKPLTQVVDVFDVFAETHDAVRPFIETVSIVEAVNNGVTKPLSEIVAVLDINARIKKFTESLNEILVVHNVLDFGITKSLAQIVTIVPVFNRLFTGTRPFTEISSIFEDVVLGPIKRLSQTSSVLDEITSVVAGLRSLSQTVAIVENVPLKITKSISEVVDVFDVLSLVATKPISEIISIVDTIGRVGIGKSLLEVVSIVDTANKKVTHPIDNLLSIVTGGKATGTLANGPRPIFKVSKQLNSPVAIIDFLKAQTLGLIIQAMSEVVVVHDNFNRIHSAVRAFTEVVDIFDVETNSVSKTLLEVLSVFDIRNLSISRSISEVIAVIDERATVLTGLRSLVEDINVFDQERNNVTKSLSAVIDVLDSVVTNLTVGLITQAMSEIIVIHTQRTSGVTKPLSEVDVIVPAFNRVYDGIRTFSEVSVILEESIKSVSKPLVEVSVVIPVFNRQYDGIRSFGEVVTIVDQIVTIEEGFARQILDELITVQVEFNTIGTHVRPFSRTLSVVEERNSVIHKPLSVVDAVIDEDIKNVGKEISSVVNVVEAHVRNLQVIRQLQELVIVIEESNVSLTQLLQAALSEVIVISEDVTFDVHKVQAVVVAQIDSLSKVTTIPIEATMVVLESLTETLRGVRILPEVSVVTEEKIFNVEKNLSEAISILDTVIRQGSMSQSLSETIVVIDEFINPFEQLISLAVVLTTKTDFNRIVTLPGRFVRRGAFNQVEILEGVMLDLRNEFRKRE